MLFWHVTDEIHLLNVAVDRGKRRHGSGRALVNEVIAYARSNAAAKILLEVRRSNEPAIRLYEGLGFDVRDGGREVTISNPTDRRIAAMMIEQRLPFGSVWLGDEELIHVAGGSFVTIPPLEPGAVLTLRFAADLRHSEIAAALGCSEEASRQAAAAGLARLRQELGA